MMKKLSIFAVLVALAVIMASPAQAAFVVGGENGWQLSTDGIVNIFGAYQTQSGNSAAAGLLGAAPDQKFGVRVGLLPSIVALNVKAPTVNGIESNVRVAFYPNVQNRATATAAGGNFVRRFDTEPNIDNREFFYTAKGKFGEFLAGRALNLFQGQNILNDMTLFTAGVVDMTAVPGGTSLGHIAYGYLYTNFGPQFRYTTPDMGGVKVAFEIAEPYRIDEEANTGKTNTPRFETEISYASTFKGGSVHAWLEGLIQTANRKQNAAIGRGSNDQSNTSVGIAPGVNLAFGPVGIMGSGYYGKGLGMVSAQDGGAISAANPAVDAGGNDRVNWGFLAQATYQVSDAVRLAVNYGASRSNKTDWESNPVNGPANRDVMKSQEALVGQVNYNLNKFTQFTLEYIWAQNVTQGGDKLRSNQVALGTVFFW